MHLRRLSFLVLLQGVFSHCLPFLLLLFFLNPLHISFFQVMHVWKIVSIITILIFFVAVIIIFTKKCYWTYFVGFVQPPFAFLPLSSFSAMFLHGIDVHSLAVPFNIVVSSMLCKLIMERWPISSKVKIAFIPFRNAISTSRRKE